MSISNVIRRNLERAIARACVDSIIAAGYVPLFVDDTGENVKTETADAVIDAVFAVDDATAHFRHKAYEPGEAPRAWVRFIGGNGEDIISDWSCGQKAFDDAVSRIAYNVEDLVAISLKAFEPCPHAKDGTMEPCTRAAGHAYSETRYGDKHVTAGHERF